MRPEGHGALPLALLGASLLISSCGAKTGLPGAAGPGTDAGPRVDAGPRPDAGRPDAGRPDAGAAEGDCRAGEPFVIERRADERLRYPALARRGDRALLVFTTEADRRPGRLLTSLPLSPLGERLGPSTTLVSGRGGTLVPVTASGAPGYTLAFRQEDDRVGTLVFDGDGGLAAVAEAFPFRTDSNRPALCIEDRTIVTAWNSTIIDGELQAIYANLDAPTTELRTLAGRNPVAVPSSVLAGWVDMAHLDAMGVFVGTYDGGAELYAVSRFSLGADLPVTGVAIAQAPGRGAFALWGTNPRAVEESVVGVRLEREEQRFFTEGEALETGAFAYDEGSGWALLAVGASAPFGMVVGYGANGRDRGRLPLSGPVESAPEPAPTTAVIATGVPEEPFLAVWDAVQGRGGAIEGVLVRCGP